MTSKGIKRHILKIEVAPNFYQRIELEQSLLLGRDEDSVDIVLDDLSVSGQHAKIVKENKQVFLEDLKSTNGTLVNNTSLKGKKQILSPNDTVYIGYCKLLLTEELDSIPDLTIDLRKEETLSEEKICDSFDTLIIFPSQAGRRVQDYLTPKIESLSLSQMVKNSLLAALGEALENSHRHGCQKSSSLSQCRFIQRKSEIEIRVSDEGEGFDYKKWLRGSQDKSMFSLGISLIRQNVDLVEYNLRGNEIILRKKIYSSEESTSPRSLNLDMPAAMNYFKIMATAQLSLFVFVSLCFPLFSILLTPQVNSPSFLMTTLQNLLGLPESMELIGSVLGVLSLAAGGIFFWSYQKIFSSS